MTDKFRLVVIEPSNSGGLVHFIYQLCTALSNEGVDVTLIAGNEYEMSSQPHNFHVEKILNLWEQFDHVSEIAVRQTPIKKVFRRVHWNVRRLFRGARLVFAWVRLTGYIKKCNPDVVQFTRIHFSFEAVFINYLRRLGFILTQICHEFESREKHSWVVPLFDFSGRNIYTNFSAIFFLSSEVRNNFLKIYTSRLKDRTHVIPHGNSDWLLNIPAISDQVIRKRYGLDDHERVVLFFGLISPSKGLVDLIEAFAIVHDFSDIKLVIAGYPTKYVNMNEIVGWVDELGITDRVIFDTRYIPLNEVRPLMNIASVVVYPYRSATQSGALQTAYSFKRPVIATAVGGLPEVVVEGKSGHIVPPQSPQAIAEKIISIANDPARAEKMGTYARYLSETRFSWGPIAQTIVLEYERLLSVKTKR